MALKIYSAVQTECVDVTSLKNHIRLDSSSLSSNETVIQVVLGGYHAVTASLTSAGTDVSGYNTMMVLESYVNSAGATLTCKIQESDDNATFTDWTGGGFTDVTTANDTAVQQIEYTGTKQYIKPYITISGAETNFAVSIIKNAPYSTEDSYLENLIISAREYAEEFQHRAIGQQTWTLVVDDFPAGDYIEIPLPPLQSVTSVNYIDSEGTTAVMTASTSGYFVDTDSEPGIVCLSYGITWPSVVLYPKGAIRILFIAGYTSSNLPKKTKQAILMYGGLLYRYRDQAIPDKDMETVNNLLSANKVYTL